MTYDSNESSKPSGVTYADLCKLDAERTQGEWRAKCWQGMPSSTECYFYFSIYSGDTCIVDEEEPTTEEVNPNALWDFSFMAHAPEMFAMLKKYREALEGIRSIAAEHAQKDGELKIWELLGMMAEDALDD